MNELKQDELFFVPHCNHAQYAEEVWAGIERCKNAFVLDEPKIEHIKFPGFVTDERWMADAYDEIVYKKCKFDEEFTPPRGNLSTQLTHIICGYKPGHALQHLSKFETSWLFGPSSKMLHTLLEDVGIYPYFTNVYKNHSMLFGDILIELEYLNAILPHVVVVFLGSYEEYNRILYHFAKNDLTLRHRNIWHPAYLVRAFTQEKYNTWKNSLKGK